jgi:hypothetical protein
MTSNIDWNEEVISYAKAFDRVGRARFDDLWNSSLTEVERDVIAAGRRCALTIVGPSMCSSIIPVLAHTASSARLRAPRIFCINAPPIRTSPARPPRSTPPATSRRPDLTRQALAVSQPARRPVSTGNSSGQISCADINVSAIMLSKIEKQISVFSSARHGTRLQAGWPLPVKKPIAPTKKISSTSARPPIGSSRG